RRAIRGQNIDECAILAAVTRAAIACAPTVLALVLALMLAACGEREAPPAETPQVESAPAPLSDVPTVAGLVVHEWGVVDVRAERGPLGELALGGVAGRGIAREELLQQSPSP